MRDDCLAVRLRAHLRYNKQTLHLCYLEEGEWRYSRDYLWFRTTVGQEHCDYFWYPTGMPDIVRDKLDRIYEHGIPGLYDIGRLPVAFGIMQALSK